MRYFVYDTIEGFQEFYDKSEALKIFNRIKSEIQEIKNEDFGEENTCWGVIKERVCRDDDLNCQTERAIFPIDDIDDGQTVWYMHGKQPESIVFDGKNTYHLFLKETVSLFDSKDDCESFEVLKR